jgi:multidrug efflux system outer membrane protein
MKPTLLALSIAALLSGCSLIPSYERPAAPVASAWSTEAPTAGSLDALSDWRAFFLDPQLQQLIQVALDNNRDLRVAALNVEAYRAQYRIQRAQLFPSVGLDGSGNRSRLPADMSGTGSAMISSQYSATLGASWELDFFGRLNSLRESALQEYFAGMEAQRAAQTSLVASVANAWLTWQADQALLRLTRDTLKTYEESLALTRRSFDVGIASALELSQAQSAVDSARVDLARYTRLQALDRNALTLLLGQAVDEALLQVRGVEIEPLAAVPVGAPSELLQQRPDILQAEYRLKAANANIGAARAAFFPRVSLTGAAGTASRELSGLFEGGSGYWSFAPRISVPIFNAGELKANLDYAQVSKNIQVAQYEQAIQSAFRDVADGLVAHSTYAEQVAAQRALLRTTQSYYGLAERRYRGGVDSYLTLLDAQRQLFGAQQQLIGDRLNQLLSEVNLYKAVGGGWQSGSVPRN